MAQHDIEEIHNSLVNGQRKQMVTQIDEYELFFDFWSDYANFLEESGISNEYEWFKDAVISYHRIKER